MPGRRAPGSGPRGEPAELPRVDDAAPPNGKPRDDFVYFISGAKERAPAAAMGQIERLAG